MFESLQIPWNALSFVPVLLRVTRYHRLRILNFEEIIIVPVLKIVKFLLRPIAFLVPVDACINFFVAGATLI